LLHHCHHHHHHWLDSPVWTVAFFRSFSQSSLFWATFPHFLALRARPDILDHTILPSPFGPSSFPSPFRSGIKHLLGGPTISHTYSKSHRSRYSDWLRAGRLRGRSSSPGRVKNFLFSTSSRPALGPTQPPIQRVLGAVSPGVKRPEREADHSPPANTEVKKMWIYTSTPPLRLHGIVFN
jgi:hypothetical protein